MPISAALSELVGSALEAAFKMAEAAIKVLVAKAGLTGTLGGALEARGIPAGDDKLIGEVEGQGC